MIVQFIQEDAMKRILKSAMAAAIAVVSVLTIQIEPAIARHRGKLLGGVSLEAYCKRYHGSLSHAVIAENHAGGWRCDDGAGNSFGISVQRACENTYAQRPIKAVTVGNGPGDWRCRWLTKHK